MPSSLSRLRCTGEDRFSSKMPENKEEQVRLKRNCHNSPTGARAVTTRGHRARCPNEPGLAAMAPVTGLPSSAPPPAGERQRLPGHSACSREVAGTGAHGRPRATPERRGPDERLAFKAGVSSYFPSGRSQAPAEEGSAGPTRAKRTSSAKRVTVPRAGRWKTSVCLCLEKPRDPQTSARPGTPAPGTADHDPEFPRVGPAGPRAPVSKRAASQRTHSQSPPTEPGHPEAGPGSRHGAIR